MKTSGIVLIYFRASDCTHTTTQDVIDMYRLKYGEPEQFTVEPVSDDDHRINWESIPSRTKAE